MKVYNKLVRDKIPEIIAGDNGKSCVTRIMEDDEYLETLNKKMQEDVANNDTGTIPMHIRNAPMEGMQEHGYGVGYKYPHDYENHRVQQQYLPDKVKDKKYYIKDETEIDFKYE